MALTGELAFRGLTISNAHLRVMGCDHRVVDRSTEDDDGNAASAKKPTMTTKEASNKINAAQTVDALVEVWNSLPIDLKQNESVIEAKNKSKSTLTPTAAK